MKEASRPEGGELTMDGIDKGQHDVIGRYSLKGSVFSEAFLVLGRVRPQGGRAPIIVIALIKVVAFLDFRCTNFLDALLQKYCVL